MLRHGIPTAKSGTFRDPVAAKRFCAELEGRCAVKADGLALGKGVLLASSLAEAERAVDEILVGKAFGAAGASIVVQELLEGMEISLHALCDGKTAKLFPTSQDHKRALDGDLGLNTGGMGTYSPAPFLSDTELGDVGRQILYPWLAGCAADGIEFRGLLYPGVMLTKSGPKVIEFNARFGDPETQVYLPRLENDLVELLLASTEGTLDRMELKWSANACVCVVAASGGLSGRLSEGTGDPWPRRRGDAAQRKSLSCRHRPKGGPDRHQWRSRARRDGVGTDTARGTGSGLLGVGSVCFEGMHFRHDIAAKALK